MKSTGILNSLILSMVILSACQGNREMVHTFGYYDTNQDFEVNPEEFNTVFPEGGDFEKWDQDNNRRLTEDEWDRGFNVYGSSYPYEERGLFDDWDTTRDDYIDRDEYNKGFFDLFDADGDGIIQEKEWGKYEDN